jgi:1,4-dihydroxy-2-naphthoate octaprenyltransferase
MATLGTVAVQGHGVPARAWWAAVAIGFLAVAVLVANNLRDLATDRDAGRHTLVVRLGDRRARTFYATLVVAGVLTPDLGVLLGQLPLLALVSLVAVPLLVSPLRISARRELEGRALVPLLPLTARLHLALGGLLAAALLVAALLPHQVGMAQLW